MAYIGYPVNLEEALRLFNLEFNDVPETSYGYHWKCIQFIDRSIRKYGLGFFCIDKNLHVIGISTYKTLGNCWENHKNIDQAIIGLLESKSKVVEGMKLANVDMSRIEITHMEGERYYCILSRSIFNKL